MKKCCHSRFLTFALCAISFFVFASSGFAQTFTVTSSPSSISIFPGQQNVPVTVTVGSSTYAGPITITLTGLPSGISVSPLILTAGTSGTVNISASLIAGTEGFPAGYPATNTGWSTQLTVVGAAGAAQASAPLTLNVFISNPGFAPAAASINLPVVNINTNGVGIVDKTTDIPGTITITSADGKTSYLPNANDSDNTATFHLHGNSTVDMPKLPYHVKLNTSLDLLTAMGMKCPYVTSSGKAVCDKSKSYVLLANYCDKTFLRDWSASALANAIPMGNGYLSSAAGSPTPSGSSTLMPWAPHSFFVELYLNGVYEGNYQLIEQIKVDSHRVNIPELTETETTTAQITGGYLMEIDQHQDEAFVFQTPEGLPIGLIDPDFTPDPEIAAQTAYISSYVDTAETALFSSNFTDPTLGWRAYFDEASAVNFYIVNDVMGNVDGGDFFSSNYLYKNANNPLIYMGPIWDFDISSGNVNYAAVVSPVAPWMQVNANWYAQWFKDPGFKADVAAQWNALMKNGVFTAWIASIQQQAASLEQSQANNFTRWPMQGLEVWPNPQAAGSYDGEVQYFTNWLALRIGYLDSIFNNKAQTNTALSVSAGTLRSGSSYTLTAEVTGGATPGGVVSFLNNGILLGTGALDSNGAASLTASNLQAGSAILQAVYNGDSNNALSESTTQNVAVAAPLVSTVTTVAESSAGTPETSVSFVASVIPNAGTAFPTGTVTFSADGGSGTALTLNGSGQATFSTSSLSAGSHAIVASYSGDGNYAASSGMVTGAAYGDFSITGAPSSMSVKSGQSGTAYIELVSQNGFSSSVLFSCSGLAAGASCSFSPATVTPVNGTASTTLTVSTSPAASAASRRSPLLPGSTLALALCGLGCTRKRLRTLLLTVIGVTALGLMFACGSGAKATPATVSTFTVTATSGAIQHTTTMTLTVQ